MDYDLALHNTRVLNDGGSVPNPIQAESYIKYLKEQGLWDSCVFFGLGGSKIEPNTDNSCKTLYDLKANADLLQATGTKQPKYNTDGSLLHDGADWTGSIPLASGNTIRDTRQKLTAIVWVKQPITANGQCYFGRWVSGTAPLFSAFGLSRSKTNRMEAGLSDGAVKRLYTPSFTIPNNQWIQLAITFDGTVTDGVLGKFSIYSNGILDTAPTKTTNLAISSVVDTDTQVSLGTLGGTNNSHAEYTVINNTYLALPQIYNSTLTAEQILDNFNNIKPTDISETYGLLTGTHINRVESSFGSIPMVDKVQSTIDKLKSVNLWDSCVFFADARIGVRKDSNQFINALYDLKANADLLQATGTAQPKYNSDGSLLHDGGDFAKSVVLGASNPIRTSINYITGICWFKTTSTSATQTIFARHSDVADGSVFAIRIISNKLSIWIFDWNWQVKKKYESSFVVNTGAYVCASFTFNAITKILKVYVNGLEIVPVKALDLTYDSPTNYAVPVSIGVYSNAANYTGTSSLYQIYKTTFTAEQILWNFNNIRPEGV